MTRKLARCWVMSAQDQDAFDAMNPAGGQFVDLADLVAILPMLLNPAHPNSLLTRYVTDK